MLEVGQKYVSWHGTGEVIEILSARTQESLYGEDIEYEVFMIRSGQIFYLYEKYNEAYVKALVPAQS